MSDILTPDQISDLAGISQICDELGADLVVIGATSLLILMGDLGRFTRDVDLTVALDFDEFERLTMRLAAIGWTPAPKLEHRWIAPRRTIIDLLPAGAGLRRSVCITWPASQFKMSLAGFDHVFASAVEVNLTGLTIRVAPPIVTALLKIIAWVDDPYRRAKDLQDIRIVLRRYEKESDRLFSDVVFDAELPDFEFANAFLLGLDMRALATGDDVRFVDQFLGRLLAQDEEGRFDDESDFGMKRFSRPDQCIRERLRWTMMRKRFHP
jgi:predicted nucleotidyltransferase